MTWSTSLWVCVHDTRTQSWTCEWSPLTGGDNTASSCHIKVDLWVSCHEPQLLLPLSPPACFPAQITAAEEPLGSFLLDRTLVGRLAALASTPEEGALPSAP